jgi:hypothetical protein
MGEMDLRAAAAGWGCVLEVEREGHKLILAGLFAV